MSVDESMPGNWEQNYLKYQKQQVELVSNFAHAVYSAGKLAANEAGVKNEPLVISDEFANGLVIVDPKANDERNARVKEEFAEKEVVTVRIAGDLVTVDGRTRQVKKPEYLVVYNVLFNNPNQQILPRDVVDSPLFDKTSPYRSRYDKASTFGQAIYRLNHPLRLTGKLISLREGAARNTRHQLAPYVVIEPVLEGDPETTEPQNVMNNTPETKPTEELEHPMILSEAEELVGQPDEQPEINHGDIIMTDQAKIGPSEPIARKPVEKLPIKGIFVEGKSEEEQRIANLQEAAIRYIESGSPYPTPQNVDDLERVVRTVLAYKNKLPANSHTNNMGQRYNLLTKALMAKARQLGQK